jgi:hypothetical protein
MIITGSVVGNNSTATQFPDVRYEDGTIQPLYANSGLVYIGDSNVCLPNGVTNHHVGMELSYWANDVLKAPGNLDELWLICEHNGDGVTYLARQ